MFKLIRDKIPEIISKKGETCNFAQIRNKELFIGFLREKLVEEVNEFLTSIPGSSNSFEELADIVTVVQNIYKIDGLDDDTFKKIYYEKLSSKGAFDEGFIMFIPESQRLEEEKQDE